MGLACLPFVVGHRGGESEIRRPFGGPLGGGMAGPGPSGSIRGVVSQPGRGRDGVDNQAATQLVWRDRGRRDWGVRGASGGLGGRISRELSSSHGQKAGAGFDTHLSDRTKIFEVVNIFHAKYRQDVFVLGEEKEGDCARDQDMVSFTRTLSRLAHGVPIFPRTMHRIISTYTN